MKEEEHHEIDLVLILMVLASASFFLPFFSLVHFCGKDKTKISIFQFLKWSKSLKDSYVIAIVWVFSCVADIASGLFILTF